MQARHGRRAVRRSAVHGAPRAVVKRCPLAGEESELVDQLEDEMRRAATPAARASVSARADHEMEDIVAKLRRDERMRRLTRAMIAVAAAGVGAAAIGGWLLFDEADAAGAGTDEQLALLTAALLIGGVLVWPRNLPRP